MNKPFAVVIAAIIAVSALIALPAGPVSAQASPAVTADPGVLPDSPFYFLKSWSESIQLFFTFDAERKAEQYLHLAEVRLAEYEKMLEKGKEEIATLTLEKYGSQLERALAKAEELKAGNEEVANELKQEAEKAAAKHLKVLERNLEKVSESAKEGIERALESSKKQLEKLDDLFGDEFDDLFDDIDEISDEHDADGEEVNDEADIEELDDLLNDEGLEDELNDLLEGIDGGGVSKSSVMIVYPNGSEVWKVGETYPIQWVSSNLPDGVAKITIAYEPAYGPTRGHEGYRIAQDLPNEDRYLWEVPLDTKIGEWILVVLASVKLESGEFVYFEDRSDAPFRVVK